MNSYLLLVLLTASLCYTEGRVAPRIVGGSVAEPHAFPYSAFLEVHLDWSPESWFCHGALISHTIVLTTARCLEFFQVPYVDIKLGAHNISYLEATQAIYRSSEIFISGTERLAIIRLPEAVVQTDSIRPIQVPPISDAGNMYEGETATVNGWGLTDTTANDSTVADVPRYFAGQIIDRMECQQYYEHVPESWLCLVPTGVGSGCSSDEGAPLVVNGTTLVGLLADFGDGCSVDLPTLFNRITADLEWIHTFVP